MRLCYNSANTYPRSVGRIGNKELCVLEIFTRLRCGVCGISNLIDTEALEMAEGAGTAVATAFGITPVAALAYLMFNLFTPPCFAAIGAMNSEIKSKKWLFGGIALQLATGFTLGYLVYQIGTVITTGKLAVGFIGGLAAVTLFAAVIIALGINATRKGKAK